MPDAFWKAAAIGGLCAAFGLAGLMLLRHSASGSRELPEYVGVLALEDGKPGGIVTVHADNTVVLIPTAPIRPPDGKVFVVWLLATRGPTTVPVGRMDTLRSLTLDVRAHGIIGNGDVFSVTIEAKDTSASLPEGPFVMRGEIESRL